MNEDIYKLLSETMKQNNEEVFSLLKIIHFYETVLFELKLMTDEQMLLNQSQIRKAEFVKQLVNLAENRAEKLMDCHLLDLYQEQTLLPKKAISRPKKRTKLQRTYLNIYDVYDSFVCNGEVYTKNTKLN